MKRPSLIIVLFIFQLTTIMMNAQMKCEYAARIYDEYKKSLITNPGFMPAADQERLFLVCSADGQSSIIEYLCCHLDGMSTDTIFFIAPISTLMYSDEIIILVKDSLWTIKRVVESSIDTTALNLQYVYQSSIRKEEKALTDMYTSQFINLLHKWDTVGISDMRLRSPMSKVLSGGTIYHICRFVYKERTLVSAENFSFLYEREGMYRK